MRRRTVHYDVDIMTTMGRLKLHLSCSLYEDGRLGEVAISHGKAGAVVRTMLTMWARTASIALQYGTPVSNLVSTLSGIQDATGGTLRQPDVPSVDQKQCSSVWDAISMILEAEFTG